MNYLAHLHLGGPAPHQLLGSLYGDFVKGPLDGRWPQGIEAGIRLHRRIDLFTDTHPLVRDARALFPAARRRVSGILLDLFFDHCLARDWADYAEVPLPAFTGQVYRVLADQAALPGALARIAPRMAEQDWLGSYRDFDTLAAVVGGMSRRLSRPELLAGGFDELAERYQPLSDHFRRFYPELQRFAAQAGMA
ncbi:ACP phosphodiesterase [Pseudomonas otitidis]|uniref:acyl carrier protein phosphodiesterase n=1 Tax=Metapseudomonas otitidis TaxID=319939 RepID=UPI00244BB7B6|nr:ACP phosphodiesterase [Pseudomonas otitidis]MDH1107500.1 ACP phosphodiesterase [Pseudomonas otitidis]MDH1156694.1 ACP phosphodiesterase [Pseudomonas otitidis]MDH1165454.1 ACP phosphodiesterase [Pseudomonas otitidis]